MFFCGHFLSYNMAASCSRLRQTSLPAGLSAATGLTHLYMYSRNLCLSMIWEQLDRLLPCWPLLQVSCLTGLGWVRYTALHLSTHAKGLCLLIWQLTLLSSLINMHLSCRKYLSLKMKRTTNPPECWSATFCTACSDCGLTDRPAPAPTRNHAPPVAQLTWRTAFSTVLVAAQRLRRRGRHVGGCAVLRRSRTTIFLLACFAHMCGADCNISLHRMHRQTFSLEALGVTHGCLAAAVHATAVGTRWQCPAPIHALTEQTSDHHCTLKRSRALTRALAPSHSAQPVAGRLLQPPTAWPGLPKAIAAFSTRVRGRLGVAAAAAAAAVGPLPPLAATLPCLLCLPSFPPFTSLAPQACRHVSPDAVSRPQRTDRRRWRLARAA